MNRGAYKQKRATQDLLVQMGAKLPLSAVEELESVARQFSCTRAYVMRQLVLRGLAAYRCDGLLEKPLEIAPAVAES